MICVLIENDSNKVSRISLADAADMYAESFGCSYEDSREVFTDPANIGCIYEVGEAMIGIVDI